MLKALGLLSGSVAIFAIGFVAGTAFQNHSDYPRAVPSIPFDAVLDGDTIVDRGRSIHIAGLDAPELGPWAHCWAEAALAGKAKDHLESVLLDNRGWHVVGLQKDGSGRFTGKIVDREGFDIADDMNVYGGAAMTSDKWDWCKHDPQMHSPVEGDRPPMGPNIWWPTGKMFDPRAAD